MSAHFLLPFSFAAITPQQRQRQQQRQQGHDASRLRCCLSLVGWLACFGTAVNAAGVLEVDVIFPRNDTYAPMDSFPVVFAVQNPALGKHLDLSINSFIRNGPNMGESIDHLTQQLSNDGNFSSQPYFFNRYFRLDTEGRHELFAQVSWSRCNASSGPVTIDRNSTNFLLRFTIKKDAQQVDLVAATAKKEGTCSMEDAVAIGVTDQTHEYPAPSFREPGGTCPVLLDNTTSPTPTVDPCRVNIDTATAASMSAALHAARCKGLNPPTDCPKGNNAVQRLAVVGAASFAAAAALGVIGFLLA